MQIHADTLQLPLQVTEVSDAPGLGCGILAAVVCGEYANVGEACRAMVRVTGQIDPNAQHANCYADLLAEYKQLYQSLSQLRQQG